MRYNGGLKGFGAMLWGGIRLFGGNGSGQMARAVRRGGKTGVCRWSLSGETGDCRLIISGFGAMGDYSARRPAPWHRYKDDIRIAIVEEGVTSIGQRAFAECYGLTAVSIPKSMLAIGAGAFYSCSELTAANIPNSTLTVGKEAFCGCSALRSVRVGWSVQLIDNYAFWGCSNLPEIRLPESLLSIGDQCFWGCSRLNGVALPDSVVSVGFAAFLYCTGLQSVTIGRSVGSIGDLAFTGVGGGAMEVTNRSAEPQAIGPLVFDRIDLKNSVLVVPAGSVGAYRRAAVWGEFGEVRGS